MSIPQSWGVLHLRRYLPTSWRKLAIAGIAGAATTVAFAAPALACQPKFDNPKAECVTEDTAKVTWTVSSDTEGGTLQLWKFLIDGQASTGQLAGDLKKDDKLPDNSEFTLTIPKSASQAELVVGLSADDAQNVGILTNEVDLKAIDWSKCKKPESASPSASGGSSAAASSPGTGGGSGVAGASSSAAASLPVTGGNTGIIAGIAVALLAVGATLFLVARRRRFRFTTA